MPITIATASILLAARPLALRVLDSFAFDRVSLTGSHLRKIRHVALHVAASWKAQQPVRVLRLVGHADSRGSAQYNLRLGLRRAEAVRQELIRAIEKISPGLSRKVRFETLTRGAAQPVGDTKTNEGRALNRRVEIYPSAS